MLSRNPLLATILDFIDGGIAIIGEDGAIILANSAYSRLEEQSGIFRARANNRPQFRSAEHQKSFEDAVAKICRSPKIKSHAVFSLGSASTRLSAVLQPLLCEDDRVRAIMIVCKSRHANEVSVEHLRAHYGLSTAEAAIAASIARGQSLAEAAEFLEVSKTTCRNQLAAVTTKLNVSRQAQVATAVMSLAPRLRLPGAATDDH